MHASSAWQVVGALGGGIWLTVKAVREFNDAHVGLKVPSYVWTVLSAVVGVFTCITTKVDAASGFVPQMSMLTGEVLTGIVAGFVSAVTHKVIKRVAAGTAATEASALDQEPANTSPAAPIEIGDPPPADAASGDAEVAAL